MKHTPGPWVLNDSEVVSEWGFSDQDLFHPIKAEGCGVVGWVDGTPIDDEERQANAWLIAAAPDLLAALKDILKYEDDVLPEGSRGREIYDAAYAAITKAEGLS